MRYLFCIAIAFGAMSNVERSEPLAAPPGDVAVTAFTVEKDSGGVLRAVADSCLERLVRTLTARGIIVARQRELSEKKLASAAPAPWAVLGRVKRGNARLFEAELRLMEVRTGDEMRSYFNADKNPEGIANFGEAAAGRIAAFVREKKASRPPDGDKI